MKKLFKKSKNHYLVLFVMIIAYIFTIYFWIAEEKKPFVISFSCQVILSLTLCMAFKLSNNSETDEYDDNISINSAFERERYEDKVKEVHALTQRINDLNVEYSELKASLLAKDHLINEQAATIDNFDNTKEASMDIHSLLPVETEADIATPTIDIITIARQVVDELSESAKKNNIQIQISTSNASIPVKAAPSRLRILFRNIVDNSIKYMNKSGVLIITISNIGTDIFIVLKDNGNGLEASETEHVFELNYQGSNRVSGNGLGLTQSKAIVEFYGGTIYAKSNPNQGMGIYIQLPLT